MSLIDIKNNLTMGINFSTPIFLLDSRNIVKQQFSLRETTEQTLPLLSPAAVHEAKRVIVKCFVWWVLAGMDLPSP